MNKNWFMTGALFAVLPATLLLVKGSPYPLFASGVLASAFICSRYGFKGLFTSLAGWIALIGWYYGEIPLKERYWYVGLFLSQALSLIILTLCQEEGEEEIEQLKAESQSRLDNCLLLDKKWKEAEEAWAEERQKKEEERQALLRKLARTEEERQSFYNIASKKQK